MCARPLARIIQESLKRPRAEELLFGKLANGGRVHVPLGENDQLDFEIEGREKATQLEPGCIFQDEKRRSPRKRAFSLHHTSEEHTSDLQSLIRTSHTVFSSTKRNTRQNRSTSD